MKDQNKPLRAPLAGSEIVPSPGFLLVDRIKSEYLRASGIVVPKHEKIDSYLAEVIAVSPFPRWEHGVPVMPVMEPGSYVILTTYAGGQTLSDEDGGYSLIRDIEVAGIVTREQYEAARKRNEPAADPGAAVVEKAA